MSPAATSSSSPWDRLAALGGVGFTVLGLAAGGVGAWSAVTVDSDAATVRTWVESHRNGLAWSTALMTLAGLCFLAVLAHVDRRLRDDEQRRGESTSLPAGVLLAGVVTAVLTLLGAVLQGMLARQTTGLDDSSLLLVFRAWNLVAFSGPPIGVTLFSALVAARILRTGVFPRWLAGVAVVSAAGGLSSIVYLSTAHSMPAAVDFGGFLASCLLFVGLGVSGLVSRRSPAPSPAPAVAR